MTGGRWAFVCAVALLAAGVALLTIRADAGTLQWIGIGILIVLAIPASGLLYGILALEEEGAITEEGPAPTLDPGTGATREPVPPAHEAPSPDPGSRGEE